MLDRLEVPVIAAPMAGGASTPRLVAEVARAGGLGFLAAGYLSVEAVAEQVTATTGLTDRPFGVNLFVPGPRSTADLAGYRERCARNRRPNRASRAGTTTPTSRSWNW